jgi:Transposase DDE domain
MVQRKQQNPLYKELPMNMDFDTFLIGLYLMVDEWLQGVQADGKRYVRPQGGAPPRLSDAEMLTLLLAHQLSQAKWRERRWLRFLQHNYQGWFPSLTTQSAYNRRARNLSGVLNALRIQLVREVSAQLAPEGVTDGTPIHVRHWRRYGPHHLALPEAELGYCAAKREYYYGYKLLALVTLSGIIVEWALLPASADERDGFEEMMSEDEGWLVWGDKGFLDERRQRRLEDEQDIVLVTPTRRNQHQQLHPALQQTLAVTRPIVETTFAQAKGFVDLQEPHAYTWSGLVVRIVAKLTALAVIAWANLRRGFSPLSYVNFAW